MDSRLQRLYAENTRPVAFIDESYELRNEQTFYILASALVYPEELSATRAVLLATYGNETIHAAPMFQRMEFSSLRAAIDISARQHDGMDVIVQTPVAVNDHNGAWARRRCLEFAVPLLHEQDGVFLFVLDSLDNPVAMRRDRFVFSDLRRANRVDRNIREHHAFPADEPLLGLPDLLAWTFRQQLTGRDSSWFEPLKHHARVHHVD